MRGNVPVKRCGSFLWLGQPGSNVVGAEGASAPTLLRQMEKCVKERYFQWGFLRFSEKSSLYVQAPTRDLPITGVGWLVKQEQAPEEPLFVGTP